MLMSSSVGVNADSCFGSIGLSMSDAGVSTDGTGRVGSSMGRVGSSEAGYERGSVRLGVAREREDMEDVDEAIDGAMLDMVEDKVEVEWLDCMDRREWYEVVVDVRNEGAGERNDEPVDAVVDIEEAV